MEVVLIQTIIAELPPMFDQINAAFPINLKTVMFSWGDRIYNPGGLPIPSALIDHEAVHGERQLAFSSIEDWWYRYIESPAFRLAEETPAHRAEYQWLVAHALDRNQRRVALKKTAARLAAPLYGKIVTIAKARSLISQPSG